MSLSMRTVLVTLLVVSLSTVGFARHKRQEVSGRIVAHDLGLSCLNGYAWRSVLIRLEKPRSSGSRVDYIRVNFSTRFDALPSWLDAQSRLRKFTLTRDEKRDEVLERFFKCVDEQAGETRETCVVPMWKFVPGAQDEEQLLPFGKAIPSYQFPDLPLREFAI